jgi:hypothetical protein
MARSATWRVWRRTCGTSASIRPCSRGGTPDDAAGSASSPPAGPAPPSDDPAGALPREATYWEAQREAHRRAHRPNGKHDAGTLDLWDGFAAVDALVVQGFGLHAAGVARDVLELARERLSPTATDDDGAAWRDLSVALNKTGDAEAAAGRGEAALSSYRESLGLSRRLHAALGDAPQVLEDLAFSLIRMAVCPAATTQEQLDAADEAVRLERRLAEAFPDVPAYRSRLDLVERIAASLRDDG